MPRVYLSVSFIPLFRETVEGYMEGNRDKEWDKFIAELSTG